MNFLNPIILLFSAFGLFKTFQHNYFAQLMEHIRSIKVGEIKKGDLQSTKGFVAFAGTMVVTAGALNIIGIEVADRLISRLDYVNRDFTNVLDVGSGTGSIYRAFQGNNTCNIEKITNLEEKYYMQSNIIDGLKRDH